MRPCMRRKPQVAIAFEELDQTLLRLNRVLLWAKPFTGCVENQVAFGLVAVCANRLRIAALEPGARFSRQASRRLQVSSMFENKCGFLKAERQVGTMERMRSQTTQISPLLSKNSSSSINPRLTMLATISQ